MDDGMMMVFPKRYQQVMARCAWLFLAGTVLQRGAGEVDPAFFIYPWNLCLAVGYVFLLMLLVFMEKRWRWVQHLYDRPSFMASVASLLILCLCFGLVRQDGSEEGLAGWLGFTRMSSSWIFVLFLIHFMTVLGLQTVSDIRRWRHRKWPVTVMHLAFFIVLLSALAGSGDKLRVSVNALSGSPVSHGITPSGRVVELPFALVLKHFTLEEYPPKIHRMVDGTLSSGFVVLDGDEHLDGLDNWQIECLEYLDMAGILPGEEDYRPMNHVGAATSARIRARHIGKDTWTEGWVSCGSYLFDGCTLPLPDGSELVMPRREVKSYLSQIEVLGEDGVACYDVRVNHPAGIGAWKIYQSGYDSARGRWSTTSLLECVRDGWYTGVHIALWMILAAGVVLLFSGWKKNREEEE